MEAHNGIMGFEITTIATLKFLTVVIVLFSKFSYYGAQYISDHFTVINPEIYVP